MRLSIPGEEEGEGGRRRWLIGALQQQLRGNAPVAAMHGGTVHACTVSARCAGTGGDRQMTQTAVGSGDAVSTEVLATEGEAGDGGRSWMLATEQRLATAGRSWMLATAALGENEEERRGRNAGRKKKRRKVAGRCEGRKKQEGKRMPIHLSLGWPGKWRSQELTGRSTVREEEEEEKKIAAAKKISLQVKIGGSSPCRLLKCWAFWLAGA